MWSASNQVFVRSGRRSLAGTCCQCTLFSAKSITLMLLFLINTRSESSFAFPSFVLISVANPWWLRKTMRSACIGFGSIISPKESSSGQTEWAYGCWAPDERPVLGHRWRFGRLVLPPEPLGLAAIGRRLASTIVGCSCLLVIVFLEIQRAVCVWCVHRTKGSHWRC